jgi:hypothetical protein
MASSQARRLSLEDIHLCKTPAATLQLLARLGYAVEQGAVPLRKEEVGFAAGDAAAIRNLYLLAEQGGDGSQGAPLQVVLFDLQEVALARLRSLAANLLDRGGNYLMLATADYRRLTFVNPRREGGQVRIAKLILDTAHPTRHDLDVLEGLAVNGQDPEALYRAQCAAFDVDRVTHHFYREYVAVCQRVEAGIRQHNRGVRAFYEPQRLQAFAQRLLGRIMFLYFIQKKGWLAGDGRFLTRQYRAVARRDGNYYGEVLEGRLYRGIVTGCNQAFVIDEATRQKLLEEDPRSAEIIKPWLRGRDVKRWRTEWAGLYVVFTRRGIDIDQYPAVAVHLAPFRRQLTHRFPWRAIQTMLLAEKPVPVVWHSPSRQAHIDPYAAPERSQCRVSKPGLLPRAAGERPERGSARSIGRRFPPSARLLTRHPPWQYNGLTLDGQALRLVRIPPCGNSSLSHHGGGGPCWRFGSSASARPRIAVAHSWGSPTGNRTTSCATSSSTGSTRTCGSSWQPSSGTSTPP